MLQLTRSGAVKVAADVRRHLKALLVTAPEPLRQALRGGTWLAHARACAALQAEPAASVEHRATVRALRLTAERALAAHAEAEALEKELRVLVAATAPMLLAQPGVGPITGRPDPDQLIASGPTALGGRLRHAGRHRTHRGLFGARGPPPAEPGW